MILTLLGIGAAAGAITGGIYSFRLGCAMYRSYQMEQQLSQVLHKKARESTSIQRYYLDYYYINEDNEFKITGLQRIGNTWEMEVNTKLTIPNVKQFAICNARLYILTFDYVLYCYGNACKPSAGRSIKIGTRVEKIEAVDDDRLIIQCRLNTTYIIHPYDARNQADKPTIIHQNETYHIQHDESGCTSRIII